MLYRASVYSILLDRESPGEMMVFFECPPQAHAESVLQDLVARAWHLPVGAIEHYNLYSELELRNHWPHTVYLRGADADTVLLQTGCGPDGATYTPPRTTVLMVSPYWHPRLAAAQEQVARLQRLQDGQRILAQAVARSTGGHMMAATSVAPGAIATAVPRKLLNAMPGVPA